MRKVQVAVLAFAVVGLLCMGMGLFWLIATVSFLHHAAYATGTVIENVARVETHTEDGKQEESTYYYPRVRFQTSSGQTIVFLASTGSDPPSYQPNANLTVLYDVNNPGTARLKDWSLWFGPGMFLGLGGVAASFGVISIVMSARKRRLTHSLADKGVTIAADFSSIDRGESIVEGESKPWVIVCQWLNPETGKMHVFKSDAIEFDPTAYVKRDKIDVRLDPQRPDRYSVDLSFLPGMAEKPHFSLGSWKKKKTDSLLEKWHELTNHSLDAALVSFYWFCMIGLIALHGAMGARRQLVLAGVLALGIAQLSLWQRQAAGWVWPGPKEDMTRSLLVLAGVAVLLGVGFQWIVPITRPANLGWYLAAAGLLVFNALQSAGVSSRKRSEFREACTAVAEDRRKGPRWKWIVAIAYQAGFVLVWLPAIAYLFLPGAVKWLRENNKSQLPGASQAAELAGLRSLGTALIVASGLLIVLAFVLDFVLKIPLLPRFGLHRNSRTPKLSAPAVSASEGPGIVSR